MSSFRMSLATANKAGARAKAIESISGRAGEDVENEPNEKRNILGDSDVDHEASEDRQVRSNGKRLFSNHTSMKSGPGTLEPEPGEFALGGSDSRGSEALEGSREEDEHDYVRNIVGFASNLPPFIEPDVVKNLFAEFPSLKVLRVEDVPVQRPEGPNEYRPRLSASMRIYFDKDASTSEFNTAMSKLNDKRYLGEGYYLHLDRYLGNTTINSNKQEMHEFGAKYYDVVDQKGFAPPPDLGGSGRGHGQEHQVKKELIVLVHEPQDPATMRLIHRIIKHIIELGPDEGEDFELCLMEEVKHDERYAFLYDNTHPLNRYYRWRLHGLLTGNVATRRTIFKDSPDWVGPPPIPHEFTHTLEELAEDDPRELAEDDIDPRPFRRDLEEDYPGRVEGYGILPQVETTFLIYMLITQPPTPIDHLHVAHVSSWALKTTKGLSEVVDYLITNLFDPFVLNPHANDVERSRNPGDPKKFAMYVLNGLLIISDIMKNSREDDIGNGPIAYKYRSIFEKQLIERKVFEWLSEMPEREDMGLLATDTWYKEVNEILSVWKAESLLEKSSFDKIDNAFNAQRRAKEEQKMAKKAKQKEENKRKRMQQKKKKQASKLMGMDGAMVEKEDYDYNDSHDDDENDDGDDNGKEEEDIRMADAIEVGDDIEMGSGSESKKDAGAQAEDGAWAVQEIPGESAAARARRLRPKAEDMFTSDGE